MFFNIALIQIQITTYIYKFCSTRSSIIIFKLLKSKSSYFNFTKPNLVNTPKSFGILSTLFVRLLTSCDVNSLDDETSTGIALEQDLYEETIRIYDQGKDSFIDVTIEAQEEALLKKQLEYYKGVNLEMISKDDLLSIKAKSKVYASLVNKEENAAKIEELNLLSKNIEPALTVTFGTLFLGSKTNKKAHVGFTFKSRSQKNSGYGGTYVYGKYNDNDSSSNYIRINFGRCGINGLIYLNYLPTTGTALLHNRSTLDCNSYHNSGALERFHYNQFFSYHATQEYFSYSSIDFFASSSEKLIFGYLLFFY